MADPTPLTEQEIADLLAAASEAHLCGTPLAADMAITVMRMIGEHDRRLGELAIIDWEARCAEIEVRCGDAEAERDGARALVDWLVRDWRPPATELSVGVAETALERWRAAGWCPEGDASQAQGGEVPSPTGTSSAGAVETTPPDAPSTQPAPQVGDVWQRTGGERLAARVVALGTLVHLLPWFPERSALTYQERITRTRGELLEGWRLVERDGRPWPPPAEALAGGDARPWAETAGALPPAPAVHHLERIPAGEVELQRDALLATVHLLRDLAATTATTAQAIPEVLDSTLDAIEEPT